MIGIKELASVNMHSNFEMSIPFLLHLLVELPAAFAFAIYPSATLPVPQPYAHAVIRQYALLLLSINIIAAIFIFRDHEAYTIDYDGLTERRVAGALALYHCGPLIRAGRRIWKGEKGKRGLSGQPWVHFVAHTVCGMALAGRNTNWW